jgi:Kef-type K+ transport system membrane component KefB
MSTVSLVSLAVATSPVFEVDTGSFLAIVATAAVAGTLVAVAGGRGLFLPVVVIELTLGVLIGPQLLDLAKVNAFTEFFGDLGLGMLFFFAGYEIDLARIRGAPLRLGILGWAMSLAIAYTLGGVLAAAGVVLSLVYVGSALGTPARCAPPSAATCRGPAPSASSARSCSSRWSSRRRARCTTR